MRKWAKRVLAQRLEGLADAPGRGAKGGFSPRGRDPRRVLSLRAPGSAGPRPLPVGLHRPGAATLAERIVEEISAATLRRILAAHQLKPWRQHVWLYSNTILILRPHHQRDRILYSILRAFDGL